MQTFFNTILLFIALVVSSTPINAATQDYQACSNACFKKYSPQAGKLHWRALSPDLTACLNTCSETGQGDDTSNTHLFKK